MNSALPCYPSVHEHRTISLLPSDTLLKIDGYVSASESSPYHHPDAILTPSGVNFSAASGPKGNITMTSLRRIVRGLNGEELAPTDEELAELSESRLRGMLDSRGLNGIGSSRDRDSATRGVLKNGYTRPDADEEEGQGDWVDGEEYALAQEEIVGEVGERGTGTVVDQWPEDTVPPQLENGDKRHYTEAEKEARKAEKRQRKKAEQSQKERSRAGGK